MARTPPQEPSPSHGRSTSQVFGAVCRWGAVAYLVLVLGVTVFVTVVSQLGTPEGDPSFVGIYLLGVTLPSSMLIAMCNATTLELTGTPMLFVLAGAGVMQAAALWGLGRLLEGGTKQRSLRV